LSFPGEKRAFVEQVAKLLAVSFGEKRVLYDIYHDAEFARLDLDVYLPSLYRTESELIVLFLCPEYANKRWCGLECRHIRQLIGTPDAERIMFFSFGDPGNLSQLGILSGDGYIDIEGRRLAAESVAEKIRTRMGHEPLEIRNNPEINISRLDRYAPAGRHPPSPRLPLLAGRCLSVAIPAARSQRSPSPDRSDRLQAPSARI
ncbi:MAG: hypothetical protein COS35_03220, partial [Zetaproteobacteria bacterium CG02_land_8_20_14_3_00_50_9]